METLRLIPLEDTVVFPSLPASSATTVKTAISAKICPPTGTPRRSTDRSELANVSPAGSLIWIWLIVGKTYSTGSSIVTRLMSSLLIAASVA